MAKINFSRKNLRSIIYNLISNAIKFRSAQRPIITIRTCQVNENLILSVEDNGVGMSEEGIKMIWGMYHRPYHDIEGQVIGMFLTKKIVSSAGGHITVDSIPGKGSKFIITIPI